VILKGKEINFIETAREERICFLKEETVMIFWRTIYDDKIREKIIYDKQYSP